jgi:hypothetical protein
MRHVSPRSDGTTPEFSIGRKASPSLGTDSSNREYRDGGELKS